MNRVPVGVNRIDHVGVLVADASAASAQFEVALGLTVDEDEVLEDVGVRLVYLATATCNWWNRYATAHCGDI
jgi:catechol 2,3-dioxygenase-like lactoylglutathione lyase family enzyme